MALLVALGCRSEKPVPPPPLDASPSVAATTPAPVASLPMLPALPSETSDASASPPSTDACPRYDRELAAGRRAVAAQRYEDAKDAYHRALHARPFAAEAWAEIGYAELLAGDDPRQRLAVARSLTKKREILAAAWFNEAKADARDRRPDAARLHYAIAAQLGNAVAVKKLGTGSTCTVTWTKTLASLPYVNGWRGVLAAMPPPTCDGDREKTAPTPEAARKAACRGCEGLSDPVSPFPCDGEGPWRIPNGHLQCHTFSVFIQPVGPGHFVVEGTEEDPPRYVVTPPWISREEQGPSPFDHDFTMVSAQVVGDGKDDAGCPVDVSAEVNLELPVHCQMGEALAPVQGPMLLRYWDMEGKGRLEVQVWQEKPEVTVGGGVAQISGAGCHETIRL